MKIGNCVNQASHPPGKPGKISKFYIGQGKVREIVVYL